jgi:two-component system sensor histidine kinase BarA
VTHDQAVPYCFRLLTIMAALLTKPKNRAGAVSLSGQERDDRPFVMVVEDHEDTLFLLTYLLGMRGCRVQAAKDGQQAISMATSECPDLILMDIGLPHLDGLAATRRMREVEGLRGVPIVFLSGHAEASFRAQALANGGDDYLIKPFTVSQLERTVERFIGEVVEARS